LRARLRRDLGIHWLSSPGAFGLSKMLPFLSLPAAATASVQAPNCDLTAGQDLMKVSSTFYESLSMRAMVRSKFWKLPKSPPPSNPDFSENLRALAGRLIFWRRNHLPARLEERISDLAHVAVGFELRMTNTPSLGRIVDEAI